MRKKILSHVLITLFIFLLFLLLTTIPILGCQGDGVNGLGVVLNNVNLEKIR